MHAIAKSHQDRIHSRRVKKRLNLEYDRISSLTDDLLHKILSFICIKQAIRTSAMSSRWKSIWTSIPSLNFSTHDILPDFVSNVLSRHNNQTQVSSINIEPVNQESVKTILDYTSSHNIQNLTITWDIEHNTEFLLSLFTSRFLQHLILTSPLSESPPFIGTPNWNLPALTTLHLDHIKLSDNCTGLFSKCTNLKNLTLGRIRVKGTNVLNICHPRLSNLTIEHTYWWVKAFMVVAPQLKNLTITHCYGKHLISTPGLTSLVMTSDHPLQLSTKGFPSLEKADLYISDPLLEDVHKIVSLLQQLESVKFLTVNVEFLERLSSYRGLISRQPFAFANLKILKFSMINPIRVYLEVQVKEKVTTSTEIKNSSPSSIFTIVSCEEIRVLRDIVSAQKLIAELRVVIKECKTLEQMKNERLIMTKLQDIDRMLTELPESKIPAIQAAFSSLCEEVDIVTNNMLDSVKIRYNKKRKRSKV